VGKIKNFNEILQIVEALKKEKKIVGFTNGCFDIIHAGHISYLEKAKALVDVLILGLNSDSSIKRIKGNNRPINSQDDRALVVSGLESVDFVVMFDEDTPQKLIELLKPNILIKGADWKDKEVAGCDFVKQHGGECKFIDFLDNRSTTSVIEKIKNVYC
jgi:rfaE bifunctional protein nucleotidyltransferase chain/domain